LLYAEADCGPRAGLYVSRDGGSSWDEANDGNIDALSILDIAVDAQDDKFVYIATMNGLYQTSNGGENWLLNDNLPEGARVSVITQHPENRDTLFAGVDFYGLFLSSDGGDTWNQVAAGLQPNAVIRDIIFDPANSQNMYLTDVASGVYRSVDGGQNWTQLNNGLSNRAATGLGISSDGLHLYVATNGEGVFRLDLNGQPPVSNATEAIGPPSPEEASGSTQESIPESAPTLVPPTPELEGLPSVSTLLLVGAGIIVVAVLLISIRRKVRGE
jgi:photosystem II stability/assembly factor-like uncharacterized protein